MTSIKMIINKTEPTPGPVFRGEGFDPLIRQLRNRLGGANLAERNRLGHEAKILREAERLRELTPERFKVLPEKEQFERRREIERLAGDLKIYQRKKPVVSQAPHFQVALQNVEFLRQITAPTNDQGLPPILNNNLIPSCLFDITTNQKVTLQLTSDKSAGVEEDSLPKTDHTVTAKRTTIYSAILSDNLAIPSNSELGPTYKLTEQFKAELATIKTEQTAAQQKWSADTFIAGIKSTLKFSTEALIRQQKKDGR